MKNLDEMKKDGTAPEWLTDSGFKTLCGGYLLEDETPKDMWKRVAKSSASYLKKPELEDKFFDIMWKNWLCLATPVASNTGTERGLNISCFNSHVGDSVLEIMDSVKELGLLSKHGGGTSSYWGDIRPRGSVVKNNGKSDGVIPFLKIFDSTTLGISQGGIRRGAHSAYLPVDHHDFEEFLKMRKPEGDVNRQCMNLHHGVCLSDDFMNKVEAGNKEARTKWKEIIKSRFETGEPYCFFDGNVDRNRPECYKQNGLDVKSSNLCLEENTFILTRKGHFKIKDLVGKTVELWDGNQWVENNKFIKTGENKKLLKITLRDGTEILSTEEHKYITNNNEIIEAKNLKLNQKLLFHKENPIENGINISGAYLKGFLVGDGTYIQDKPLLWLYEPKYCCEQRLINSAKEIENGKINTNAKIEVGFNQSTSNRKIMSGLAPKKKELFDWATSFKLGLPLEDMLNWSTKSKCEFIAGVMDADGSVIESNGSKCYQISSINKEWLLDFQLFLKTLNVYSTLGLLKKKTMKDFKDGYGPYSSKECWRLTISNVSARILSSLVNFTRLKNFEFNEGYKTKPTFNQIKSIESYKNGNVYCTNVDSTHMFALTNGLMTGNCNEIYLHSDSEHTFVCCLSSLNLARWDEWKNTDLVQTSIWFLDGIMEEFIQKASKIVGFEKAVRFSIKSRALGLGVVGFHSLLQKRGLPFDSMETYTLNNMIFKHMRTEADKATADLAKEYGEPEWCKGFGRRNTHCLALAPTVSNALISGNVSPSIEPWAGNAFTQKSAKGTFLQKNKELETLLETLGQNTDEVWLSIVNNNGSVEHLDFLSGEQKEVFLTAREINQFMVIKLASARQKYLDQGQSVNLFFPGNSSPKYINDVHLEAYRGGLNGLYYLRSTGVLKADSGSKVYKREQTECSVCEG